MIDIDEYLEIIDKRGPDTEEHCEKIEGIKLKVDVGIWNPNKGKSTKMFLEVLKIYPLDGVSSVLDIGTGTAIIPLLLHKKGIKNILGVDDMSEAVDNAKKNIKLNNAKEIQIKKSNLFSEVEGKFDLIIFNAPATHPKRHKVSKLLQPLWSSEENIRLRFLESLSDYLSTNGRALLMYSIFEDYNPIPDSILRSFPFSYEIIKKSKGQLSESGILEIKNKKKK